MSKKMKVAIALSGGTDSAVAGYLLKREGHNVFGICMIHYPEAEGEKKRASLIAERLGIEFYSVDLREEFTSHVVQPFISAYLSGKTPSPCPVCNRDVKMGCLLATALKAGAQKMATGHYARVLARDGTFHLFEGKDRGKGQAYFLSLLTQEQLSKLLLPLGEWRKRDVEKVAIELNLKEKRGRGSQEICFLRGRHYGGFILERIKHLGPGPILDIEGNVIGEHKGYIFYTIGQRRGLGIARGKPLYVVKIIPYTNTIVVGEKDRLYSGSFWVPEIHWINEPSEMPVKLRVKVRYRSTPALATLEKDDRGWRVNLKVPQRAVTPGQLAVFYKGEEVMGGGWIEVPF